MIKLQQTWTQYCRWCNNTYKTKKLQPESGFCSNAHKQAHYRAYKKYVTAKKPARAGCRGKRVTQKKPKR